MTETQRMSRSLSQVDPEIYDAIQHETARQDGQLELIASENFTSEAVLEATGSVFTNKYAEGYPGKRYYGGCEYTDVVENLARERAKKLFGAEYVNVQPHSGSQANQAAYGSVLTPGDTIMGLNLAHGGHLTHGHPLNFSGKLYKVVPYNVRKEDELIDYDEVERLAREHQPKLIVAGASAYPRIIDFARFRQIADLVGAVFLVDMAHISGLVAAGVHPNPCEYADIVTTTTHKTLRGPRAGMILAREKYGKEIDKNVFPGTQGGPLVHVLAAKAVCFLEAMQPEFVAYQKQVVANARAMAQALMDAGFRVVSGGTDTHVVLLDVFSKGLRGKEAEQALDRARITVNKNAIPFDTNPPMNPSGIRLGSPAVTTRGFQEPEMREVGSLIAEVLTNIANEDEIAGSAAKGGDAHPPVPALRLETRVRAGIECSHIVIDARRIRDFGIGTYIRSLVHALGGIDLDNQYTLVSGPADVRTLAGLPENFHSAVYARSDHSALDHVAFPLFLRGSRRTWCTSRWNRVPLLMIRPYVVTIHDMANLFFEEATSNFRMQLRRYRFGRGLRRAARVVAVSEATKRDVESQMGVPSSRISRVYNAPDPAFFARASAPGEGAAAHSGAVPDPLSVSPVRRQYPPAQEYSAAGGGVRRGARATRRASAVQGPAAGDYRRHDFAIPGGAAGGDEEPGGKRGAFSGLRAVRNPALLLRIGGRFRVPVALRGLRTASAGSDGLRHAGGLLEREFAAGGGGRCGHSGESGERLRHRTRHQRHAAG